VWVATALGALYIALEHRFYGVSMPAHDYSTASLALLSSRQAYVYALTNATHSQQGTR
jgi:hypothetical protein